MPVQLNGQTFYCTAEACAMAGTSKSTFFRWVREGVFADVEHRDRNSWRLFTKDDLARLRVKADHIQKISAAQNQKWSSARLK